MSLVKQTILEEVNQIVHKTGFKSVTFSNLASKIGTSRENIHHHFKTKEKLGISYLEYLASFLEQYFLEIHQLNTNKISKIEKYYALYRITQNDYASCPLVSLLNEYQSLPLSMQKGVKKLIDIEFENVKIILTEDATYTDIEIRAIIMLLKGAVLYDKSNELYFNEIILLIKKMLSSKTF